MSQLIALVATAVMLNGERTLIEPGQPLPELSTHDARALLASGAAQDSAALDAQAQAQARAAEQAGADFAQARERVQQAMQSTAAPAEPAKPPPPTKKPSKE